MAMANPSPISAMAPPLASLQTGDMESAPGTRLEDQVQSPSLSTPSARARFEFENGRANDGTKVLMVEWEDSDETRRISGTWTVSWEGKPPHVLPAEEKDHSAPSTSGSDASVTQTTHRLYFLLGPRKMVPGIITLTLTPNDGNESSVVWKTNPLPAIFPPTLSTQAGAKAPGKGVLHSIWAEKRVQKLEREIEEEARLNCEGIALQMAITEKEWIEKKFGLVKSKPSGLDLKYQDVPRSPTSPLSPGGSRLSEKLRGLKLQTVDSQVRQADDEIAVPMCKRKVEKIAAAAGNNMPSSGPQYYAAVPDRTLTASSMGTPQTASSLQSIGAVLSGTPSMVPREDEEKDLFALPLSPRSPEMTKSPFSFAAEDIRRYTGLGAQRV